MCNPTTGSPTITLFQLRSNYHTLLNPHKLSTTEKIQKISRDEKLRKLIGQNGKKKYMKYFNSDLVSEYIIDKTLNIKTNKKYLWEK